MKRILLDTSGQAEENAYALECKQERKLEQGQQGIAVTSMVRTVEKPEIKRHQSGSTPSPFFIWLRHRTKYNYDAAGQLKGLLNYAPDDSVTSKFEYEYDAAGLRTLMTTLNGAWTYDYDVIGQLTDAVFAPAAESTLPAQDIAYEYDAMGNRLSTTINGVTTAYTPNELNQYETVGDTTYVYDADGNLVQELSPEGTTTYTYNADNMLVMVAKPGGDTWEYTYDAFGNRVAISLNGQVTEYVIDPIGLGDVVGQYNGSTDAWQAGYTHGFGLVNQTTAAGSYYYDFDVLGSTAAVTDALGTVVNTYSYLPFGGELAWVETVANDFQFVGQWGVVNEANGLEFMRARFYDPEVGRFVAADPIGINGSMNLQEYATNNPVVYSDPLGLIRRHENGEWFQSYRNWGGPGWRNGDWGSELHDFPREGDSDWVRPADDRDWAYYRHDCDLNDAAKEENQERRHRLRREADIRLSRNPHIPWYEREIFEREGSPNDNPGEYVPAPPNVPTTPIDSTQTNPVRSVDPNDKLGPAGYGDDGYIAVDMDQSMVMPYTIRFENMADATAPAQWIRITDTFDEDLDLTTFELTEFMLGGEVFAIPTGLDSYQAQIQRTIEGHELVVEVAISLDRATRTLSASFMALDPATGWMPENPLVGLLYPNDQFGRGDGSISYVVDTVAGLPSGRRIENEARIYFDFNDPIDTPPVVNTIDAAAPTSWVEPLPAETIGLSVTVSWDGHDENGAGAGIAGYDIYVSDNGVASDEPWLEGTTDTSAVFSGVADHTYAFYSVAIDNAGHREAAPETADTQTTVKTPATVVGRHIFYNNSAFDFNGPNVDPEEYYAIVPDKTALLPGEKATFANYTSYSRGINAIIVDIAGLPDGVEPTVADFEFRTGNDNTPADWDNAPSPAMVYVCENLWSGNSDLVMITWLDAQICNTWLEVTVEADSLGLPIDDVFYFGNAVAEAGNSTADAKVTTTDLLLARNNPRSLLEAADICFPYDYNRDSKVDAIDVLLARNNQTSFLNALNLIQPVTGPPEFLAEHVVQAAGADLQVDAYSVPEMADFNDDGLLDLIVGEQVSGSQGKVQVYLNTGTAADPVYAAGFYVQAEGADLTVPASGCLGVFPQVMDFDHDGLRDLLVGLADGQVQVRLNTNTNAAPLFGSAGYVEVGMPGSTANLDVGNRATVEVVDYNNDGRDDLLVGAYDGKVRLLLDQATSGTPEFHSVALLQEGSGDLVVPDGRSSPAVYDLNGDGRKDLIAGNTSGQLWFYANAGTDAAPVFAAPVPIQAAGAPIDLTGDPRSRPWVGDRDGDGVPEILVGAYDGLVRLYSQTAAAAASPAAMVAHSPASQSVDGFFNELELNDLTGGAEEAQEPPLANLVWLTDLDQPATHRPVQKDAAAAAVDRLLATYWP